ncbi:endonuclease III domain-containing protein [Capnocytophaga gingivalis]|uniref:endonuclease III domain-containing protein n=1 Tax=Capnocytophaga gingivalis TaxID=1017 RepID=UPI003C6F3ACE
MSQKIRVFNKLLAHYGKQYWWNDPNRITDWISMILIQQTTQQNTEKALANLEGNLSVEALHAMPLTTLQEYIRPAGFYKQKSTYIKALIEWYVSHGASLQKFQAIPTEELRKELLSIKGVGEETADAMLLYIFERKVFIADQYAIRLLNRLNLSSAQTYKALREECMPLVAEIPLETCQEWHAVIDVHGKAYRRGFTDEQWLLE